MHISMTDTNKIAYMFIVFATCGLRAFEIAKAAYRYYGLDVADGIEINCRANPNKEYVVISGDCDTSDDYIVIDKMESGKYKVTLLKPWEE